VSPGPTFDRVYLALKEQLMSGRFAPGEHLEPVAIGHDLNASITPVRDALHRLVGERLVEAPRHNGFTVPSPTEAELRDLYAWNAELLSLALRGPAGRAGAAHERPSPITAADLESWSTADLFRVVARRRGNPELEAAVENLSDRLAPLRIAEHRLFEDFEDELLRLKSLVARGDSNELRREFLVYHRRRQKRVPDLLLAWRHQAMAAETTIK
jgi:DNA-binding GntR family transcriptional regulator